MKAIEVQKTLNNYLGKKLSKGQIEKAQLIFNKMNELRLSEGLDYLTLPNLQAKFIN